METFFIGDTHFGHNNILKYEPSRDSSSIEEMNEMLIDNWNKVVKAKDKVIHVGDFCFGSKNIAIAGRLKGIKYLIAGNHDVYPTAEYLKYFQKVLGCMEFDNKVLSHMPVHKNQLKRYTHNIHGHLHSKLVMKELYDCMVSFYPKEEIDHKYINVSCENIGMKPISYAELKEKHGIE